MAKGLDNLWYEFSGSTGYMMIRRREFLVLLASLTAVFGTVRAPHLANKKTASVPNNPRLVLHKGWVLRSDDPRDM